MPIQIVRDRETFVVAKRDRPRHRRGVAPFSKCKVYSNRAAAPSPGHDGFKDARTGRWPSGRSSPTERRATAGCAVSETSLSRLASKAPNGHLLAAAQA